jgi:putative Mg2+ transporter-C (MgtC) family protein
MPPTMSTALQAELLLRVAIALLVGLAFGIEREITRHAAGMRTMMLVCTGACLFTSAGYYLISGQPTDPTRIAAQVVTGVGFLGAGAIFRSEDTVRGLTTAATVWLVAAVGVALGFGLYLLALGGATVVLLLLIGLRPLEKRIFERLAPSHPMRRETDKI